MLEPSNDGPFQTSVLEITTEFTVNERRAECMFSCEALGLYMLVQMPSPDTMGLLDVAEQLRTALQAKRPDLAHLIPDKPMRFRVEFAILPKGPSKRPDGFEVATLESHPEVCKRHEWPVYVRKAEAPSVTYLMHREWCKAVDAQGLESPLAVELRTALELHLGEMFNAEGLAPWLRSHGITITDTVTCRPDEVASVVAEQAKHCDILNGKKPH